MNMPKLTKLFLLLLPLFLLQFNACKTMPEVSIVAEIQMGPMPSHGLDKLTEMLKKKKIPFEKVGSVSEAVAPTIIVSGLAYEECAAAQLLENGNRNVPEADEALTIWKTDSQGKPTLVIAGYDEKGLMYALLDVANRISWITEKSDPLQYVKEASTEPYVKERGLSLYTMNRRYWESRFYDDNFWTEYFDMMAQNRFNMLEILFGYENGGFMAPCYPYFFNVEGFPEVKMEGITAEQQKHNLETMNHVIQMAHDRGIGIRLSIWDHIYHGGVQAGGNPDFEYVPNQPQPFQVGGLNPSNILPYTKAAVAKFVKLIPDLDAILYKTNNESGLRRSELHDFGVNFFNAIKENSPGIKIDIHGKGITDTLISTAIQMGLKVRIAPKFWMEQMGLPFSPTHVNKQNQRDRRHGYANMLRYPQNFEILWKLWNGGTNRVFLWGSPEYARRFVESSHFYNSSAYEVYEPMATKMESQAHDSEPFELLNPEYKYFKYDFERYWNFFQMFGLLGYDPQTPADNWDMEFKMRLGDEAGPIIESALQEASWIMPRIVASCYPYNFFPTTSAWPEKQRLGDLTLYSRAEGSDIQQFASYDEEAQVLLGELETAKTSPSTTSFWLQQLSEDILKKVDEAEKVIGTTSNKEFNSTVVDLKMLANLALFHSRRIPAGISYCLFKRTSDIAALDEAIAHEQNATEAWQQIVDAAGDYYPDRILIGKNPLSGHWKDELAALKKGIEKLKEQRKNLKPEGKVKAAPKYQFATDASNSKYFTISHIPTTNSATGQSVTVTVKVSAQASLKWVHLRYRAVNQYLDFEMLPMKATGEKDTYQATIPANKIDTTYSLMYLIEVMDKNDKGFIYPDFNKETPYKVVDFIRN